MSTFRSTEDVSAAALSAYDAIIDVRSPSEFAEDRLPGAVNLPVLDDAERAEVGTLYVQVSRFEARRLGAAYVAKNIARHLETALADRPSGFKPLIHCWRGGQRSHAMATILSQVGWPVTLLSGGYKTWRRAVMRRLYEDAWPTRLVVLDGGTGTAKTELLARLSGLGVQTLDLEGLAAHRGSLFGGFRDRPQPSQKLFESELVAALDRLDWSRPVVIEAESSKVGERIVPPALWAAMNAAPRIEVTASREARAAYLVRAYADILEDREALETAFARLPVYPGRKRIETWRELADAGEFVAIAEALMEHHYDPAYERSSRKDGRTVIGTVDAGRLGEAELERAARQIADLVR